VIAFITLLIIKSYYLIIMKNSNTMPKTMKT